MRQRLPLLLLLGIFIVPTISVSQSFYTVRNQRAVIFSGGTGSSTYFGDLANRGIGLNLQPNLNVGLQYFVHPRISARAELNWFVLEGSDASANEAPRRNRNLSFRTNCFE